MLQASASQALLGGPVLRQSSTTPPPPGTGQPGVKSPICPRHALDEDWSRKTGESAKVLLKKGKTIKLNKKRINPNNINLIFA